MNIMFVCTGNTCRSAMAEGIAKKIIKEKKIDINVCSAGIYVNNGMHASYNSIEVMQEHNVDLVLHRATNIANCDIESMDYIFCATKKHKALLMDLYPDINSKIYTLKEFYYTMEKSHNKAEKESNNQNHNLKNDEDMNNNYDIADPWGGDLNSYRLCAAEIYYYVEKIINFFEKNQELKG